MALKFARFGMVIVGGALLGSFVACGGGSSSGAGGDDSVYAECYDDKKAEGKLLNVMEDIRGNKAEALKDFNEGANSKDLARYIEYQNMLSGFKFTCVLDKATEQVKIADKAANDAISKNKDIKIEDLEKIQFAYVDGLIATAKKHPEDWARFNAESIGFGLLHAIKPHNERKRETEKPCSYAVDGIFVAKLTQDFGIPYRANTTANDTKHTLSPIAEKYCSSYSGQTSGDSFLGGRFGEEIGHEINELLIRGTINSAHEEDYGY